MQTNDPVPGVASERFDLRRRSTPSPRPRPRRLDGDHAHGTIERDHRRRRCEGRAHDDRPRREHPNRCDCRRAARWQSVSRESSGGAVHRQRIRKLMGATQIEELGEIETPILLTNTLAVPRVADALIDFYACASRQ